MTRRLTRCIPDRPLWLKSCGLNGISKALSVSLALNPPMRKTPISTPSSRFSSAKRSLCRRPESLYSIRPLLPAVPSSFLKATLFQFGAFESPSSGSICPSTQHFRCRSSQRVVSDAPSLAPDLIVCVIRGFHPDPLNQEIKNRPSQGQAKSTDLIWPQGPGLTNHPNIPLCEMQLLRDMATASRLQPLHAHSSCAKSPMSQPYTTSQSW